MDVYVARQPIFSQRKEIFAYELLFRGGTARYVPDVDGDEATSTVLSNTFFAVGMESLLGGRKAFINFTASLLLKKVPLLLPREQTVVEILENVEPTAEVVAACAQISRQGYLLALDDFAYALELDPLIELADIIKFDFRASSISRRVRGPTALVTTPSSLSDLGRIYCGGETAVQRCVHSRYIGPAIRLK